jgi:stage III sporulation protein AH
VGKDVAVNKTKDQLSADLTPSGFGYEEFAGIDALNGEVKIASEAETKAVAKTAKVAETLTAKDVATSGIADSISTESKEPGAAVFVNKNLDSTYFVQERLSREQARAKQKDVLTEMINNNNIQKEQKAEYANALLDIQKRIEKETATESMIKAEGFSEVYVRIDDKTVDVVVSKEALSEAEMAQIEDIVVRKTGAPLENIRITPLKSFSN